MGKYNIDLTKYLNEKQVEAASLIDGPVIVFAGAGTGKTRTLTYRVAHMVDSGISPNNILAITFTNKATNEMKDRLDTLLGSDAKFLTISTFHALCARILRKDIVSLGYDRHFEIIDEEDQLKIINEAIENKNVDKKKYTAKHMRKVINTCKCFSMKCDFAEEEKVMEEYERLMKEQNLLDFEDLLIKTYELFSTHEDILDKYQYYYRYILVDEFQDTNDVEYKLIKLLSKTSTCHYVVGDPDQTIYTWRGANQDIILNLQKDYLDMETIILNRNYRSTTKILNSANKLIAYNKMRVKKDLYTENEEYSKVQRCHVGHKNQQEKQPNFVKI